MIARLAAAPLLVLLVALGPAAAQEVVGRNAPLRTELLDTLRPVFERETGGPVEFVVRRLARWQGFAFASVRPQRPGGGRIDWRRTRYREAVESDTFGNTSFALLQRIDGRWRVVETAIGPTDVAWIEWQERYRLPGALFEE